MCDFKTGVSVEDSVNRITKLLAQNGVSEINAKYSDGEINELTFIVNTEKLGQIPFRVPVNPHSVGIAMQSVTDLPLHYLSENQYRRVAWNAIRVWIRDQMDFLESKQVVLEQIFLSYAVLPNDATVFTNILINQSINFSAKTESEIQI